MKEFSNFDRINKIFKKNNGFITREDLKRENIPTWFLTDFKRKMGLTKMAPGFYASKDYIADEYYIFQKRYPKFIFSGLSALYLHHLTDKIPLEFYVTSRPGYNPCVEKNIMFKRQYISNNDIYKLGITTITTMFGNSVKVYDIERTICDLIKYRNKYDSETFIKAIKWYVKNKPNQIKLMEYAKIMKIEKKVFEIMEIILNED